jgi:hypothetical protein
VTTTQVAGTEVYEKRREESKRILKESMGKREQIEEVCVEGVARTPPPLPRPRFHPAVGCGSWVTGLS